MDPLERWHGGCTAARWHGNTVARWCDRGAPGVTETRLQHVGGRSHDGTGWQVAWWDGGSVARFQGDLTERKHGGTVKWWHGEVAVIRCMMAWRHGNHIHFYLMRI